MKIYKLLSKVILILILLLNSGNLHVNINHVTENYVSKYLDFVMKNENE